MCCWAILICFLPENNIEFEAVSEIKAFDEFISLIIDVSNNQDCHLITMCPNSLLVFRNWCSKCNPTLDFYKMWPRWTSLANIMSMQLHERTSMKAYSLKHDRLETYFNNVTNSTKSLFMKNSIAMREICEQLFILHS